MSQAIIIICTRLESRRLPSKAIMEIEGLSALDHILLRIKDSGLPIYLAVPFGQAPAFQHYMAKYPSIGLYEGNSESPLHRMAGMAGSLNPKPDYIVRITHDDLLIDSKTMLDLVDEVIEKDADYGCTPKICEGAGVEVIRTCNLIKAADARKEPTEFVSYFVKDGNSKVVRMKPRLSISRPYRLTLDYPEDALVLKILLRELGAMASLDTICRYLDSRPYLLAINRLPDVTFYTCAKDMQEWVGDTMLSVLGTDVPNMEYIVVDDGSMDGTLSEIAKFSNDQRVTLIVNDKNIGLASSSNVALDNARGRLLVRVDADDTLIAGSFRNAWPTIQGLIADGVNLVYPAFSEVNEYGGFEKEVVDPRLSHHAGCAVMDRAWLNEWRFRDGIRHWDSLELYRRVRDSARIAYLDQPLWQYRRRKASLSQPSDERSKVLADLNREVGT